MNVKLFEMRDVATFIPMMAIQLECVDEAERHLLARSGYGLTPATMANYILVGRLDHPQEGFFYSPEEQPHPGRMQAHQHILENWDTLASGDVIDVEYLRGDSQEPKVSERYTAPW